MAQGFFGSNDLPQSSAELVETRTVISRDAVRPGEDFQAALEFDIADTWHINSFRPLQDYLIATELSFETHPRLILAETQYPSHKLQRFDFAGGEQLAVYEGREAIFLSLRGADGLEPGDHTVRARQIAGEDTGRKAEGRGIGAGDRFFFFVEIEDDEDDKE